MMTIKTPFTAEFLFLSLTSQCEKANSFGKEDFSSNSFLIWLG